MVSGTDMAPRSISEAKADKQNNVTHCEGCFVEEGDSRASNSTLGH